MALAGTRILLVEDEGVIVMLAERLLEALGCEVVGVATRVADALDKVALLTFDIALLDVNLAGRMSYPVAEALQGRGLPFVFATGYGSSGLPPHLRGSPVVGKPYSIDQLGAALQAARGRKELLF